MAGNTPSFPSSCFSAGHPVRHLCYVWPMGWPCPQLGCQTD